MKRTSSLIILIAISLVCSAQTEETKYYRSYPFDEEVGPGQARYSKTTIEDNGIITAITRNLKKEQVESSQSWKGDEPVGIRVGLTGRGPEEMDYNFQVTYGDKNCSGSGALLPAADHFQDNTRLGYMAPVVDVKDGNFVTFIRVNLRYPAKARRTGTQGKAPLAFTITKEGIVQYNVATKGVDIVLDKEAARLIRKVKFKSPPMVNGQPQEVCVKMPISFKLA